MRRLRPRPLTALLATLTLVVTAAGCGNQTTVPSPVLATDNFTGTLNVLGADTKRFTVTYTEAFTDASVTVTSLTTTGGTAVTSTIGVAFGSIAFDQSCTRSTNYTASAATIGQELVASGVFGPGTYCVQIFDSGTLTEAVNYAMTVKHY